MTDGTLLVVAGTRPEFVKLASVLEALEASSLDHRLVHTGQHYDECLSADVLRTLALPEPDHRLGIGSAPHAAQTAEMLAGVAALLRQYEPAIVLAQGDTNSTLATGLAAAKRSTDFAHVEAGLRSGDRSMPEEVNRVLADHVAVHRFAPTETAAATLADEGITEGVAVVGNTVVDACHAYRDAAARRSTVLDRFALSPDAFVLATIHRPRNTDDPARLRAVLEALDGAPRPVVLPAHPRTLEATDEVGFDPAGALRLVDPLDYLDFLRLLDAASVVVTDSGGVQEEAAVLETPCLTVRPNTERPETLAADVNELVEPADLGGRLATLLADPARRAEMTGATDIYGDGRAGERIVSHLEAALR